MYKNLIQNTSEIAKHSLNRDN